MPASPARTAAGSARTSAPDTRMRALGRDTGVHLPVVTAPNDDTPGGR
ncbi:hypothetical protein ACIF8W_36870 [Streptomyces sp. NPDC085639]